MSQPILLISERPEDLKFIEALASACSLTTKVVKSAGEGVKIMGAESPIVFVDVSTEKHYLTFEEEVQTKLGLLSGAVNPNHIHFISSSALEHAKYLTQSPLFGHFVPRSIEGPARCALHYSRVIRASLQERAFGLNHLMKAGVQIQNVKLDLSSQKQEAVEAVRNYLLAAKFQSRMATIVANAVDEILMNAMFDAPTDDFGRPLYTATARTTEIKLQGKANVEMQIAYDGEYVAILARDHYGSLDKLKLMSHISKVYTEEEYKVRTSVAGAGIGLATVFRTGASFFFACEPHVKTEVAVFFKRTDTFRQFKDQFHFISTLYYI